MRSTGLAFLLALLALLLMGCGGGTPAEVKIGSACPEFELDSLDGEELSNASFTGKPFVLSFWATWCQPCFGEIPVLKELEAEGEIQVVTIALDEKGEAAVRPFVNEQQIDYTVLLGNEDTFADFDGFAIPYTLVFDAQHRVVNLYRGPITDEAIQADLAAIAASAGSESS